MIHKDLKRCVVFAHGWGYTPAIFDHLTALLAQHMPQWYHQTQILYLHRPYWVNNDDSVPSPMPAAALLQPSTRTPWVSGQTIEQLSQSHPEHTWIGVGHSMGFGKLLQLSVPWVGLCSIHGFSWFTAQNQRPGVPAKVLQRMQSACALNPSGVLSDFQRRCGFEELAADQTHTPNVSHLLEDLGFLQTMDLHPRLIQLNTPLLALYGEDEIVTPLHSAACFSHLSHHGTVHRIHTRAHSDFAHNPQPVAHHLLPFLNAY